MSIEINHPPPLPTATPPAGASAAATTKPEAAARVDDERPVAADGDAPAGATATPETGGTREPWADSPVVVHGGPPAAVALDVALAFVAAATPGAGEDDPAEEEFVKPWSRPMGLEAGNRMLRFLYLDQEIGWIFRVPNDATWWTGRETTPLEDAIPAHEAAEEKKKLSALTRRNKPVAPDAVEAPTTPVVPGPLSAEQAALLRERDLHRA